MEQSELEAMAKEMAKSIKTQEDLGQFTSQLMKVAVEAALGAEMEAHLGYGLNERSDSRRSNHRNGSSKKRLISDHGEIEITTPRDRDGSFDPKIIGKRQSRLTQFDDQILTLYTKGMSTRDIVATFKEMYGAEVSPTLISKVTDAVNEQVVEWQNRLLDSVYPILYLDCIVLKIRQDNRSSSPREPPPQALREPYMNVSAHTAPIIQPMHTAISNVQTGRAVFSQCD